MRTMWMLYKYPDRDDGCVFDNREDAERYLNVSGRYKSTAWIEEIDAYGPGERLWDDAEWRKDAQWRKWRDA